MKLICVLLFFLGSFLARGQEQPIQWKLSVEKRDSVTYTLMAKAAIAEGWYIYDADGPLGITPLDIESDPRLLGMWVAHKKSEVYADPIFGQSLPVYRGQVTWRQVVTASDLIDRDLVMTIRGYAANGETFLPLEHKEVVQFSRSADSATIEQARRQQ